MPARSEAWNFLKRQISISLARSGRSSSLRRCCFWAASVASLYKAGPRYGIDFKGGALVYVKFAERPPIEKVRSALAAACPAARRKFRRSPAPTRVIIGTEMQATVRAGRGARRSSSKRSRRLSAGRTAGKLDINSSSDSRCSSTVFAASRRSARVSLSRRADCGSWRKSFCVSAIRLRDPVCFGTSTNLPGVPGVTPQMIAALKQERLRVAVRDPQHRNRRSEDRAGAEAAGCSGNALCLGRNAGLHCVAV